MYNIQYLHGHQIECKNGKCFYVDTGELTSTTYKDRPCGHCGKFPTKEGHDACLGTLPGLMNACCGHGQLSESYVQFMDGIVINGEDATTIIEILKKHRK